MSALLEKSVHMKENILPEFHQTCCNYPCHSRYDFSIIARHGRQKDSVMKQEAMCSSVGI